MFLKMMMTSMIFLSTVSFARTIEVFSFKTNFKLEIDKNHNIAIKGRQLNLSLIKNKCNSKIIEDFIGKTQTLIKAKPLSKTPEKGRFKVIVDGKEYYESRRSKVGFNLIAIPKEIQRMKIQEKMLCKTQAKSS